MVAEFLNFFPQYRLEDLRRMAPQDFIYLYGGMLDVKAPHATESAQERVARAVREHHERVLAKGRQRNLRSW